MVSWLQQLDIAEKREPDNVQVGEAALEEHTNSVRQLEALYTAVQNSFRESHKVSQH